jgi:hypothetical protein
MQFDVPTVHLSPDFHTRDKLIAFAAQRALSLPSSALQRSPGAIVRPSGELSVSL